MPVLAFLLCGCGTLRESSKYSFNDGIYTTRQFSKTKVYVLRVEEDTIAVFPVLQFKDSTAILTKKRVNYTSLQRKLREGKTTHAFYKPSFDFDLMTIPLKYRPAEFHIPNQLNTNFNGAFYGGYRLDEYKLIYKRTPLNNYKQTIRHRGYSGGLYCGVGSTVVSPWVIKDTAFHIDYEGVTLISGLCVNMATDKLQFGLTFGFDHLLDRYHSEWIYQGKPCVGFSVGLDLN